MSQGNVVFRLRGLWFGLVFWAGFSLYAFDPRNAMDAIVRFTSSRWHWNGDITANSLLIAMCVCGVLAAALRRWASAYLSASVVHDAQLHSERLVADGPYRHVRNPLYLGTVLMAIGWAFMASRVGALVIVAGVFFLVLSIIRTEETGLLENQGEQYHNYLRVVPRLFPTIKPGIAAGGRDPNWMNGIRSELYMWSFAAGLVGFAITRTLKVFFAGLIIGIVILIAEGVAARQKKKSPLNA